MNDSLLSLCCGAPSRWGVHHNGQEYTGICSKCGEHASFELEDEEDEDE